MIQSRTGRTEPAEPITVGLGISILHATYVATQMNFDVDDVVATIVSDKIRCCGGMNALITAARKAMKRPNATVLFHVVFDDNAGNQTVDLWL